MKATVQENFKEVVMTVILRIGARCLFKFQALRWALI